MTEKTEDIIHRLWQESSSGNPRRDSVYTDAADRLRNLQGRLENLEYELDCKNQLLKSTGDTVKDSIVDELCESFREKMKQVVGDHWESASWSFRPEGYYNSWTIKVERQEKK